MTRILGISAFYHDSAAALIVDGVVIAAAQQERFSRIKHDPSFPKDAIRMCLAQANCKVDELDAIIFYDKPLLKFERLLETYLANAPRGFLSFARAMPIWLKEKLYLKNLLRRELSQIHDDKNPISRQRLPQLLCAEHHQSHAAAAFFASPFRDAAVLCLDGVGEWATSSLWLGKGNQLNAIEEIHFPHSLGLLYSAFTYYCGFKVNSGEYKLMGLAPYGEAIYKGKIYQHLITVHDDGSFQLNMRYFDFAVGKTMVSKAFERLFAHPRFLPDQELSPLQMDLAASIQAVIEEIVLKMAQHLHQQTGANALCLAGGVALNCVANGRLLREGPFDKIWIQPASGDAGSALGAALLAWHLYFDGKRADVHTDGMQGAYLGDEFSDSCIQDVCEQHGLVYHQLPDEQLFIKVSNLLQQNKVLGWFQGRMEFGPRALGNRSILGDPRSPDMQRTMNLKIKQRESFRPFAPAVLAEDCAQWFDLDAASPYMLLVAQVNSAHLVDGQQKHKDIDQARSVIPAVTHVDYSARVQSVDAEHNPRFYRLLQQFKQDTGLGMLINTSFNVRGEPPVHLPEEAIRGFLATDMDVLVMQNIVLYKSEQTQEAIQRAKEIQFEKD